MEPFSHTSTSLTPGDVLPPNHSTTYDDNLDSQRSLPSLSPISEDFDDDELPPRTRTPTPQSEYSDDGERLSIKMARWILTEDPNLTEAKEGYRLFPERPEFKQMVDRRNHQKFHETEELARSALKQVQDLVPRTTRSGRHIHPCWPERCRSVFLFPFTQSIGFT